MAGDRLRERIADQFSGRGDRADVWRGLERFLPTDRFLNLGYSPRFQPHLLGSSQRRLAAKVGAGLASRLPRARGRPLLDVGCGRGGPALELAEAYGFDVTGVDLVAENVARARANADRDGVRARFVVADATALPFRAGSFAAGTSIDALVYVPEKAAAFGEFSRVLEGGAPVAVSDLLVRDGASAADRAAVDAFADAWDMPPIPTVAEYRRRIAEGGFAVETVEDVTPNSVGRFRKWARLYLALERLGGPAVHRVLDRWDLDADAVTEQVRLAAAALPHLRHRIVHGRNAR